MELYIDSFLRLVPLITALTGLASVLTSFFYSRRKISLRVDVLGDKSTKSLYGIGLFLLLLIIYYFVDFFKSHIIAMISIVCILGILSLAVLLIFVVLRLKKSNISKWYVRTVNIINALFGFALFTFFIVTILHLLMTYNVINEIEIDEKAKISLAMEYEKESVKYDAMIVDVIIKKANGKYNVIELDSGENYIENQLIEREFSDEDNINLTIQLNKSGNISYGEMIKGLYNRDLMVSFFLLNKEGMMKMMPTFLILLIIINWYIGDVLFKSYRKFAEFTSIKSGKVRFNLVFKEDSSDAHQNIKFDNIDDIHITKSEITIIYKKDFRANKDENFQERIIIRRDLIESYSCIPI